MSLCARIEEWAKAQGIDDWSEDLKKWASEELGWDEYKEIDLMTVDLGVTEVVEALREFADTPPLRELDDAELGRWVAENNGFSWEESIDELVEDDDEAFTKATAFIAAQHKA
jgi:hypothetical protein